MPAFTRVCFHLCLLLLITNKPTNSACPVRQTNKWVILTWLTNSPGYMSSHTHKHTQHILTTTTNLTLLQFWSDYHPTKLECPYKTNKLSQYHITSITISPIIDNSQTERQRGILHPFTTWTTNTRCITSALSVYHYGNRFCLTSKKNYMLLLNRNKLSTK